MLDSYKNEVKDLYLPNTAEICKVLSKGLTKYFRDVHVAEVDCPDLSIEPWSLATKGICGSPKLLDVGGPPYLVPTPQKDKIYNFDKLAQQIGDVNSYFLGAGAAASHIIGTNAEMMANLRVGSNESLQTYIAKVNTEGNCDLQKFHGKEFCLLGNFLACEGVPGKVIKVNVKVRTGKENFIESMRHILKEHYPDKMIGLGGTFLIKSGKAKLHVMPDFSSTPLNTDTDVSNWLNFYEMSAPLVCLSVFYNLDDGLDLRIEHTHCFSHHGEGGHYHYDTTPADIEYEGYFVLAEKVFRIDRPLQTHKVGRD